jgi:hypothetical protein
MNKKIAVLFSGILVIILLLGYGQAIANPGDVNDPLVTKKYVDEQINLLKVLISQSGGVNISPGEPAAPMDRDALWADLMIYIEAVYGEALRNAVNAQTAGNPQAPYEAVFVQAGQAVIGFSGTEMILRGGEATAVSGINGIVDVTVGEDVVNGEMIYLNHLHIIPGGDGRGMRAKVDSYLMIKGEYYIVD